MRCVLELVRRGHHLLLLFIELVEEHPVDALARVILLEALELFLSYERALAIVDAFFLPFFASEVVLDEFAVRLILQEEAEFAVAVESGELALVAIGPTTIEAAFLDHCDPVLALGVAGRWVRGPVSVHAECSEIHESAVACECRGDVLVLDKLVLVRINHLSLPIADPLLRHLVQRIHDPPLVLVLHSVDVHPDVDELGRSLLQLDVLKGVELLGVLPNHTLEPWHEVLQVGLDLPLQRVPPPVEPLDQD